MFDNFFLGESRFEEKVCEEGEVVRGTHVRRDPPDGLHVRPAREDVARDKVKGPGGPTPLTVHHEVHVGPVSVVGAHLEYLGVISWLKMAGNGF